MSTYTYIFLYMLMLMYVYRHTHLILVPAYELTHIHTEDKLPKMLPNSSPSNVLSYPTKLPKGYGMPGSF